MHLMSTATLSSLCSFCFMVSKDSAKDEMCCLRIFRLSILTTAVGFCFYLIKTDGSLFVAVIHYFLSPLLVAHGFIPVLLSNLLFMVAASYYHYLNFLGYDGKMNSIS